MKFKELIIDLIESKVDVKGILLLIDYAFMMGKITEFEKIELLSMVEVEAYSISEIIDYIPKLYHSSDKIDLFMLRMILKIYVSKTIITQAKANEIKSLCN